MGKVLQIVVYVILILSGVSLFFANKLHDKRELLIDRTDELKKQIINLAKTIEEKDAEDAAAPEVNKDISEVTDREITNPEKQNVLEDYSMKLETANLPTFNLDSRESHETLGRYYLEENGEPVWENGKRVIGGKGTMQELLGRIVDRAKVQQGNLNKTRSELAKMRENFSSAINEVNKWKADERNVKKELKFTQEQVATLTKEKEDLNVKVASLTKEKKSLQEELDDQKDQVEKLNEEKMQVQEELANAQKSLKEMQERLKGKTDPASQPGGAAATAVSTLTAGIKGKIVSANNEYKFCIIEFSPDAMVEMLGENREKPLPMLEMKILRPGRDSAAGNLVTHAKLSQAVAGKNLVVAQILSDWDRADVVTGDEVFF